MTDDKEWNENIYFQFLMPFQQDNQFNPNTIIDNEGVQMIKDLQQNLPHVRPTTTYTI